MATFLINFKPEFADAVEAGIKRQTIRPPRADGRRPKRGDTVKLYTGLRTAAARLLRADPVDQCLAVRLELEDGVVIIDGRRLDSTERGLFARADGFATWQAMQAFFLDLYGGAKTFDGYCVRWNPKPQQPPA